MFVIPDYWYTSVVFDWVVEIWLQAIFIVLQLEFHEVRDKSPEDSSQSD